MVHARSGTLHHPAFHRTDTDIRFTEAPAMLDSQDLNTYDECRPGVQL
jgi:hypothetical protein